MIWVLFVFCIEFIAGCLIGGCIVFLFKFNDYDNGFNDGYNKMRKELYNKRYLSEIKTEEIGQMYNNSGLDFVVYDNQGYF